MFKKLFALTFIVIGILCVSLYSKDILKTNENNFLEFLTVDSLKISPIHSTQYLPNNEERLGINYELTYTFKKSNNENIYIDVITPSELIDNTSELFDLSQINVEPNEYNASVNKASSVFLSNEQAEYFLDSLIHFKNEFKVNILKDNEIVETRDLELIIGETIYGN